LRTWFTQLFTYATVVVPNLKENPSNDLDVVALPLLPVNNSPFLRMPELPLMLQTLLRCPGRLNTQLGVRLLLLTGMRTGELRLATPDRPRHPRHDFDGVGRCYRKQSSRAKKS